MWDVKCVYSVNIERNENHENPFSIVCTPIGARHYAKLYVPMKTSFHVTSISHPAWLLSPQTIEKKNSENRMQWNVFQLLRCILFCVNTKNPALWLRRTRSRSTYWEQVFVCTRLLTALSRKTMKAPISKGRVGIASEPMWSATLDCNGACNGSEDGNENLYDFFDCCPIEFHNENIIFDIFRYWTFGSVFYLSRIWELENYIIFEHELLE